MLAFHLFVFYGSFLVFPFILFLVWVSLRKVLKKAVLWLTVPLLLLSFIFVYARFIERYLIQVYEKDFVISRPNVACTSNSLKIAIFSDPHLGVYKKSGFLEQIVEKVNATNPDLVLIPGDFTYYVDPKDFQTIFAPLRDLKAPVYAVTGNHDAKKPGELSSEEVRAMVSPHDVNIIDNKKIVLNIKGCAITLVGLSDIWEGMTNYDLLRDLPEDSLNFVLVHNPDAAYEISNYFQHTYKAPVQYSDLIIAGHTHGGQIRIPYIYKYAIPTQHDFDQGFYDVKGMKVFVTSGVGEVGLPMRFLVAPEIIIMNVKVQGK